MTLLWYLKHPLSIIQFLHSHIYYQSRGSHELNQFARVSPPFGETTVIVPRSNGEIGITEVISCRRWLDRQVIFTLNVFPGITE